MVPLLVARLNAHEPETGRLHALWALDAIGGDEARRAIGSTLADPSARVRLQAARSAGIRGERAVLKDLVRLLGDRDAAVRREAAIAIGKLGDVSAASALYAALGDADTFAAWSVRQAIRRLDAWDKKCAGRGPAGRAATRAGAPADRRSLGSPRGRRPGRGAGPDEPAPVRSRIVANLAGLYRRYPEWSGYWFGTNPLAGQFPQKTQDWSPDGMKEVLEGSRPGLADRDRSVRFQAIVGLSQAGQAAAPALRSALVKEPDPDNQAVLAEALGMLGDAGAVPRAPRSPG